MGNDRSGASFFGAVLESMLFESTHGSLRDRLDEGIDHTLERRAHMTQGDCIYGCDLIGIPTMEKTT